MPVLILSCAWLLQVEILYEDRLVYLLHDVISDNEVDLLISLSVDNVRLTTCNNLPKIYELKDKVFFQLLRSTTESNNEAKKRV